MVIAMLPRFAVTVWALAAAMALAQTPPDVPVVKGAPFTAKVLTESTRDLPGGDRVVRRGEATVARDSEGRTRREQVSADGARSTVIIQDPVAGFAYIIDTPSRTVYRSVISAHDAASPAPSEQANRENLGMQILEGVVVDGFRLKRTVPPTEAGTEHPIEAITETWYSDELHVTMLNRSLDPRTGESTYRLTGVKRGEPEAAIFVVPDTFDLRDGLPGTARISMRKVGK
jgi:hypothetical protein